MVGMAWHGLSVVAGFPERRARVPLIFWSSEFRARLDHRADRPVSDRRSRSNVRIEQLQTAAENIGVARPSWAKSGSPHSLRHISSGMSDLADRYPQSSISPRTSSAREPDAPSLTTANICAIARPAFPLQGKAFAGNDSVTANHQVGDVFHLGAVAKPPR